MLQTQKHIRKPLYVDAVQVTTENFLEAAKWCTGDVHLIQGETPVQRNAIPSGFDPTEAFIKVRVNKPLNIRQTRAVIGDWILYTERGGYKVYTPKAFEASFDPVPEEAPAAGNADGAQAA